MNKPKMPLMDNLKTFHSKPDPIWCPACMVDYYHDEQRPAAAGCPVCQGKADLARRAELEMTKFLNYLFQLPLTQPRIDEAYAMLDKLPSGYWNYAIRRQLRHFRETAPELKFREGIHA